MFGRKIVRRETKLNDGGDKTYTIWFNEREKCCVDLSYDEEDIWYVKFSCFGNSCWFSLAEFPLDYRVTGFLSEVFSKSLNMRYIQIFNELAKTIITSDEEDLEKVTALLNRRDKWLVDPDNVF